MVVSMWKIFEKAGEEGWKSLIPLYNVFILLQIVGKPWWWMLLLFVPFVNFAIIFLVELELAKAFGKDIGFAIGMLLLPFIFMPMLAFSDARFNSPLR